MRSARNGKRQSGFTLVEVIVVLVILAILAAILIPSMIKWIRKAEEKRLITVCRTCVTAAQTLAAEKYASADQLFAISLTDAEVRALAGIKEGKCTNITLDLGSDDSSKPKNPSLLVKSLTYRDADGVAVTYLTSPEPHYVLGEATPWALGQTYNVGDLMVSNGYIFKCIRAHSTGTTSRTRDPSVRSNKSSWEVIGYADGATVGTYSSTVRYAPGVLVSYKGKTYARKNFNLVGGQVPYEDKDSDYWIIVAGG